MQQLFSIPSCGGALFSSASRQAAPSSPSIPKAEAAVRASAEQSGVPFAVIGKVGGDRLAISVGGKKLVDEPVSALRDLWSTAFARALESADVL